MYSYMCINQLKDTLLSESTEFNLSLPLRPPQLLQCLQGRIHSQKASRIAACPCPSISSQITNRYLFLFAIRTQLCSTWTSRGKNTLLSEIHSGIRADITSLLLWLLSLLEQSYISHLNSPPPTPPIFIQVPNSPPLYPYCKTSTPWEHKSTFCQNSILTSEWNNNNKKSILFPGALISKDL